MTDKDARVQLARERLSTAVLSDTLDRLGLFHQIMSGRVRPLDERLVLCGRARTGRHVDVPPGDSKDVAYAPSLAFVDSLRLDDVAVLDCGGSQRIQPWGELFSEAAMMHGAVGCVTDGVMRDVRQIRALGFPVFCAGYGVIPLRGRSRLVAVDEAVHCGGVWVSPGDIVFGDTDGVVVVPQDTEEEVLRLAIERAGREREIVRSLSQGQALAAIYRRFGSL